MKRKLTRFMAVFLSIAMCLQMSGMSVFAMEEYDPASQMDLAVPELLQDGNNYFFIPQPGYTIGEKSTEKLYIPVQRTGNLDGEADVTVKIVDVSAHVGENYDVEILDERVKPETVYGGDAVIDLIQNATEQDEVETMDENQFAESVYEAGGAELLDANGQPVGTFHAYPLDENGDPVDGAGAAEDSSPVGETGITAAETAAAADTGRGSDEGNGVLAFGNGSRSYEPSGTGVQALKDARDAYTGTTSDRQEMISSENLVSGLTGVPGNTDEAADADSGQEQEDIELVADNYPGREYALHFSAGENAKLLVVTPKYSEKTDGNVEIMAMLKNPSEETPVHEGYFMTHVTILDEDEPEAVVVSMAADQITAEDGKAYLTVTREGRINAIVGVNVASWDGSAEAGKDYSGINANLYFPMGITERTIELPVGQGAAEKDFSVTLTPVTECEIAQATTRVVIPASDSVEEADLMADNAMYGDAWDLKGRKSKSTGGVSFNGDTSLHMISEEDQLQTQYISLHTDNNYAWDGVHVDYSIFTWYAEAQFQVEKYVGGKWQNLYAKDWGDLEEEWASENVDVYFGSEQAPYTISIDDWCHEVHNGFRDSFTELNVNSIQPIKRQFDIVVDNPESLDFIGMKKLQEGVINPYERFLVNGTLNNNFTILTGDSFSVSPIENADNSPRFTRLVGIDAVKDGKTLRVLTLNGDSETPNVRLDPATINKLASKGFITWTKSSNGSCRGKIHFRPVFEYKDVTIEVKDNQYGSFKTANLSPGTHTKVFHMGDELTMETNLSATGRLAGLTPSGFDWTAQTEKNGKYLDDDTTNYINGSKKFMLNKPYYIMEPTFTETANQVVVKVDENDLQYFDETKGLFATEKKWKDGSTWHYLIQDNVQANQIAEMQAVPKDPKHVPVWTTTQDTLQYSGQAFYIRTGTKASDNAVTLTVSRSANSSTWYSLSGTVYAASRNISSGYDVKADEYGDANVEEIVNKAAGALVASGTAGTYTDENGAFTLVPQYLSGGTTLRYIVTYNGTVNIREVRLPFAGAQKQSVTYDDPANPGATLTVDAVSLSANLVDVAAYSAENAHFGSVYAVQEGKVSGVINAVSMNGKKTVFTVNVEPGQPYFCGGEELTENIKEVRLFFRSTLTGDIHGEWSSEDETSADPSSGENQEESPFKWDPETGTATLAFDKFDPDEAETYDVGDVLYAQLITDRKVDGSAYYTDEGAVMVYDAVSTGITVTSDLDYEPETANYDMPLDAESIMGSMQDDNTRASYGQFPFIGEITFAVKLLSPIKKYAMDHSEVNRILHDLEFPAENEDGYFAESDDLIDESVDENDPYTYNNKGYTRSKWNFNIAVKVKETPYGGTRFMMAVVADIKSGGKGYEAQKDPYETKGVFENALNAPLNLEDGAIAKREGWSNIDKKANNYHNARDQAHLGGGYYSFSFFLGVYFDFGWIEITKTDGSTEKSHDFVFMGGGGFFGANAMVGVTKYAWCIAVPVYFNFEGNARLTVFAGWGADPNKTLEMYANEKHHDYGDGWGVSLDVQVNGSAAITFGAGLYKIIGLRATGGISAELDYSLKMADWYPNTEFGMGDSWGYGTNITFSGTIDLLFVSLPLWEYSWDGPFGDGFVKYFRQVRQGNVLIQLVNQAIEDGDGSAEAREECRRKVQSLQQHLDAMDLPTDDLENAVDDLRDYAYDHDVINYAEMDLSRMTYTAGIAGAISRAIMLEDDEDLSVPMSGATDAAYFVRDHVNSEWAANNGELMSGYDPVSSTALVENAYAQPNSRIMSIGDNNLLMVFLDDRGTGSKTQSAVLKYTIYNADKDRWSEPAVVQNDMTGDSKPDLVDAGGKLILSWASTTDEKYQALRTAVAEELKAANGSDPSESDIESALEADAARVMAQMDIFTVEFDKDSQSFGEITQLTDDSFYDDYPQAVYDSETGDYIVLYTKIAQDNEKYSDTEESTAEEQKVLDLANPYAADKTYSLLCYMLYNNQTNATDTNGATHEAGWASDYLFDNETVLDKPGQAEFLEGWKGQRFLSSPITREKDGKVEQTDPPIADLTVCQGYNGLAAYAYTVDMDQDVDTGEDKALFLQFYNFKDHKTYVPLRVAGTAESTQMVTPEDKTLPGYSYVTSTEQVNVGMPKMVRNGGSTWLFWREGGSSLRYLNVSDMLNAKVETGPGDDEWAYAVGADGTFAMDSRTGQPWKPDVQTVDFGSAVSVDALNITDYQVFTDAEDNLYVIYTDTTSYETEHPVTGTPVLGSALEIFATAKVKEESDQRTLESSTEDNAVAAPASWSKPNRITDENEFNDGLAVAQDENGDLIIIHNRYTVEDKRSDLEYLQSHGMITTDENGKEKLAGDPVARSPITLTATRCVKDGRIEVSDFDAGDHTPMAGDKVTVTAKVVNSGLTAADGYTVDFYACKGDSKTEKITTLDSSEVLPVNNGERIFFDWTVPSDGPEGYSFLAVVKEKKKLGGWYEADEYASAVFHQIPEYTIDIDSVEQNGDVFDVNYTVTNTGNAAIPEGTSSLLKLSALHGDLKKVYGMDDNLLLKTDISGLEPGENVTVSEPVSIPASVFRYCGYDAVKVQILSEDNEVYEQTGARIITMDEPMNLQLNGGKNLLVTEKKSAKAPLTFDTNVFLEDAEVVYAVEDNSIANVDAEGNVTGLGIGTTTLTATLLPSGRSVSVKVAVAEGCSRDDTCPISKFSDASASEWYHDGVHWALDKGVMKGTGETEFSPNGDANRGMIVTMLYRMDGEPEVTKAAGFEDVASGKWYADAVSWAVEHGITNGTTPTTFEPEKPVTREQFATFLCRYAEYKGMDVSTGANADLSKFTDAATISGFAVKAVSWAVNEGIITGMTKDTIVPKNKANRAQVATMFMRYDTLSL